MIYSCIQKQRDHRSIGFSRQKKTNEIAHTWAGEKSGTDWLKEHALTAFVEKHPGITSPQEKIATLEKTIAGEAQPFNHFMKETRERTSQTELRY